MVCEVVWFKKWCHIWKYTADCNVLGVLIFSRGLSRHVHLRAHDNETALLLEGVDGVEKVDWSF